MANRGVKALAQHCGDSLIEVNLDGCSLVSDASARCDVYFGGDESRRGGLGGEASESRIVPVSGKVEYTV